MKRWLPWLVVGALAVGIQAAVIVVVSREPAATTTNWQPISPVAVASLPPLVGRDGRALLARGRPAIVYFWATWCEPCVRHLPEALALASRSKGDFDVWLVSRDAAWDAVMKQFDGHVPASIVHDAGGRFGDALAVDTLPTSFLIDARGQVVARAIGQLGAETTWAP